MNNVNGPKPRISTGTPRSAARNSSAQDNVVATRTKDGNQAREKQGLTLMQQMYQWVNFFDYTASTCERHVTGSTHAALGIACAGVAGLATPGKDQEKVSPVGQAGLAVSQMLIVKAADKNDLSTANYKSPFQPKEKNDKTNATSNSSEQPEAAASGSQNSEPEAAASGSQQSELDEDIEALKIS